MSTLKHTNITALRNINVCVKINMREWVGELVELLSDVDQAFSVLFNL